MAESRLGYRQPDPTAFCTHVSRARRRRSAYGRPASVFLLYYKVGSPGKAGDSVDNITLLISAKPNEPELEMLRGRSAEDPLVDRALAPEARQYPYMLGTNPRRRHPKTFVRIDHAHGLEMANTYPAGATGFSWDEWGESALENGARPIYEGVFWIYERHILYNAGGPSRKWNIRREFDKHPSAERKLYYSDIDKRIHLFGAQDGWTEFGHILGSEKMGEIRYFDTNGDGYFDSWEFDMNNDGQPERIAAVMDPKARHSPFEYNSLSEFYTKKVLPEAIATNQKIITGFKRYVSVDDGRVSQLEAMAGGPIRSESASFSTSYASITTRRCSPACTKSARQILASSRHAAAAKGTRSPAGRALPPISGGR